MPLIDDSVVLETKLRHEGPGTLHDCKPLAELLTRVGDKWSVLVLMLLGNGPKRFNELRRVIGGISQRMLTLTLKGLERDGLVLRTVYPTKPPSVEYELTPLGDSLRAPIVTLTDWARVNYERIEEARTIFDGGSEPATNHHAAAAK